MVIAELADRQHGVVSRAQLLEAGLARRAIGHRLQRGRLHVVHRGVYAVGRRRLAQLGIWMAAVLACGPGAVLSHRAAAALWGIRRGCPARVDVTVARRLGRRPGVCAHRATLPPDEMTVVEGIPATTAARTLFDLASDLGPHELERAIEQAEALGLADMTPLAALVERYPGRPGTAGLKAILRSERRTAGATRSELEDAFLAFVTERGLPLPEPNVWLQLGEDWIEGDCVWRRERVVVELDSWHHHRDRGAFRRDRARDRRLRLARWEPLRVTAWDLDQGRDELEQQIAGLLALTTARHATP